VIEMGNVYVLRKQDDSGFAGTALQMDSSGQGSLQIPIGTGKRMTSPLKFLPYLAGGYGALRSLASRDQTDLGSALASAAMSGLTNYSTFDQLGSGAERLFRDRFGREKEAPLPSAPTIPLGQLPMDEMELRNNTSQAPVDNTGNTVAQNLRENPILPFGFENIPETPMPGETPDSARMIEQASQMGQNPSIPFGREAMPTPTGQMTDAQRAVMSQSGSRMMPPTPEQQEAMRRNAQAQNAPQRTLDEFGFSRFG
tara:strand:- start:6095 stop:6859 length:765 start_codon:yes stop_codon:yes gene_type:complete